MGRWVLFGIALPTSKCGKCRSSAFRCANSSSPHLVLMVCNGGGRGTLGCSQLRTGVLYKGKRNQTDVPELRVLRLVGTLMEGFLVFRQRG